MSDETTYFVFPLSSTLEERNGIENLILNKGKELGAISPTTSRHSDYDIADIAHPSYNSSKHYAYAINSTFDNIMAAIPEIERGDYVPTANCLTATDDFRYPQDQLKEFGFFPESGEI